MQLLQIDVPTEALEPEVTESTLSILSLMTNGGIGAQIIMSILFIMSIMAIYLFVSRLSAIKRSSQMDSKFMDDIKDYITMATCSLPPTFVNAATPPWVAC